MTYTAAGHGYVNAEVMKHIDEIQLKEMSDILQEVLQDNDQQAAKQVAQEMEKKGELMGERAPPRRRCWPAGARGAERGGTCRAGRRSLPWTTRPATPRSLESVFGPGVSHNHNRRAIPSTRRGLHSALL